MKWEYKIESVSVNERWSGNKQAEEFEKLLQKLNAFGAEGWEMISYESVPMTGTFTKQLKGYSYLVFFKRKLELPLCLFQNDFLGFGLKIII